MKVGYVSELSVADVQALEAWLRREGAVFPGVGIEVAGGGKGLGVFAKRRFREGQVMMEVPRSVCLEVPMLPEVPEGRGALAIAADQAADDVLATENGRQALLALSRRLLADRQAEGASRHAPYISTLTDPPPLHPLADMWPKGLADWSPLLARFYRTVVQRDDALLELLGATEKVWKRRRWALGAVWTRAFELSASNGSKSIAMVPLIDMVNHWTPSSNDNLTWTCRYTVTDETVSMFAERDVNAGEELSFLYSNCPDGVLLAQYGIQAPEPGVNIANEAGVSVTADAIMRPPDSSSEGTAEPGLVSARAATLQRHGWADLRRELLFSVPPDLRRDGSLLALARLLAIDSVEELERLEHRVFWIDSPGAERLRAEEWRPELETRAWRMILEWVQRALSGATNNAYQFLEVGMETKRKDLLQAVGSVVVGEVVTLEQALEDATRKARGGRRAGKRRLKVVMPRQRVA